MNRHQSGKRGYDYSSGSKNCITTKPGPPSTEACGYLLRPPVVLQSLSVRVRELRRLA